MMYDEFLKQWNEELEKAFAEALGQKSKFMWRDIEDEPPTPKVYKYKHECPCGIHARDCEYHAEMFA